MLIYLFICFITTEVCLFITLDRKNFLYIPQLILLIFRVLCYISLSSLKLLTLLFHTCSSQLWSYQSFIEKHYFNIHRLLKFISIYNVNSTPNKAGQILEVVNIILHYKIHLKQTLLAVSSLDKQDLILGFI